MREWTVGGGLLLGEAGLLLVRNRRRDGSHDWSPPGGVIEDGESIVDGLTREVAEETGVEVLAWQGPAYHVVVTAPELGWRARVETHVATAYRGELHVDDPDGIVVDAAWVDPAACGRQLDGCHRWVVEPLLEWLDAAASRPGATPPTYRYHVAGTHGALVVTRVDDRRGTGPADVGGDDGDRGQDAAGEAAADAAGDAAGRRSPVGSEPGSGAGRR
jgi:8-oxo-dGTP diphosphatase